MEEVSHRKNFFGDDIETKQTKYTTVKTTYDTGLYMPDHRAVYQEIRHKKGNYTSFEFGILDGKIKQGTWVKVSRKGEKFKIVSKDYDYYGHLLEQRKRTLSGESGVKYDENGQIVDRWIKSLSGVRYAEESKKLCMDDPISSLYVFASCLPIRIIAKAEYTLRNNDYLRRKEVVKKMNEFCHF